MDRQGIAYQPALDGLRALAVAAVIAYHLGYPWAQGGFMGVDTFFVLSGFLITSLLLAERSSTGSISLGRFWARRGRRLLPGLFLMLIVVCLYGRDDLSPFLFEQLRGDAVASVFYVANWHFVGTGQSYFALFVQPSPLNHLWSLAIEEQFYLLWPLAVVGVLHWRRGSQRALLIATVVGIAASQIAMTMLYSPANPSRAYYGTEARAHSILIGCLLALVLAARPDLPRRGGRVLTAIAGGSGLVACFVVWSLAEPSSTYFHGGSLAFALVVALLITALIAPAGPARRLLAWRPLRFVGEISYGLYLWHWPVIVFVTEAKTGLHGNILNAFRILVTAGFAVGSYYALERPIVRGISPRLPKALLPAGLAAALAGVLLIVFVGVSGAAPPPRFLGQINGALGQCGSASGAEREQAARELRRLGGLPKVRRATPLRVTMIGDSRACSLLTGLEIGARAVDARITNGSVLGCGVVAGAVSQRASTLPRSRARRCAAEVRRVVDRVVASSDPEVVLWLSGWEADDLELRPGHDTRAGSPAQDRVLAQRMDAFLARVYRPGRKVLILTLPEDSDVAFTVAYNLKTARAAVHLNQLFREFAARHPDEVGIVDFARYVCPHGRPCPVVRDGIKPRPDDGIHFSPTGAGWAARWVWTQVLTDSSRSAKAVP